MGVEEEFFLLDPDAGHLLPVADRVIDRWREGVAGLASGTPGPQVHRELFQEQIEVTTPPCVSRDELHAHLVRGRWLLAESARGESAVFLASGLSILGRDAEGTPTRDARYERLIGVYGLAARTLMCATQVHVEIASPAEGARVVEGMRPWFPLLLAITANSPLCERTDTGYDSWRSRLREMWPTTGFPRAATGPRAYERLERRLLEWAVADDVGTINFGARISKKYPTVEIRVADACTDVRDAVLLAVLVRAMVETLSHEAKGARRTPSWLDEELRAAHWRAARYGLSGPLVDPEEQVLRPAGVVCDHLTGWLGESLERQGDLTFVGAQLDRLLRDGNGAEWQRRALRSTGSAVGAAQDAVRRSLLEG